MKSLIYLFIPCLLLAPSQAADRPKIKVKPSPVSQAQAKDREKLYTEWMIGPELDALVGVKRGKGEQIIFFEEDHKQRKFRAIFTNQIPPGPSLWTGAADLSSLERQIDQIKKRNNYDLVYVTLDRDKFYQMLFMPADKIPAAQKVLSDLGVGLTVVK